MITDKENDELHHAIQTEQGRDPYHDPEFLAFIPAMRAAGDDVLPFLVAADWLEEKGAEYGEEWQCGERAKLIRGMCEANRRHLSHSVGLGATLLTYRAEADRIDWTDYESLPPSHWEKFSRTLVVRHADRWFGDIPPDPNHGRGVSIRNGFVHELSCHVHYLCSFLNSIYKYHPIERVSVFQWSHEDAKGSGRPIIKPSWRNNLDVYTVAGGEVTFPAGQMDGMEQSRIVGYSPDAERARAQLIFGKRWPGVKFTVNI